MLHNKIVLLILSQLTTLSTSYKGKEEFGFIYSIILHVFEFCKAISPN